MKKVINKTLIFLITIAVISFMIVEVLILIEGRNEATEKVDYVIILGARLYGDIPSPALLERLKVSKDYLLENEDIMVIVTGGQGPDEYISEAQAMKNYLIENSIGDNRIIVEDKATTTFENLQFSLDKIKELDANSGLKILIATNKYHLFRAKFLAKRLGMEPYGLPAKIPPTIIIKSYIREYFAVIKSIIFDK